MSTDVVTRSMSKTERQTLIRLVKQRFRLLGTAVNARRHQLEAALREEIVAEHAEAVKRYEDRMRVEVRDPMRELWAALYAILDEAEKEGLSPQNHYRRSFEDVIGGHTNPRLTPADMHKEVEKRLQERLGGKPLTQYALELEESKLIEELLLGDLSSDGAQEFMARIPSAEGLIPLANSSASAQLEEAK